MTLPDSSPSRRREAGVTLVEMLVVVAIIGVISLVSVPAFMAYMQSAKVKSSLRQFTNDLRGARQRAVTRARPVKVTFEEGSRSYQVYIGDLASPIGWTALAAPRELEDTVTLHATTFEDLDADERVDIVFRPNGSIAETDYKTEAADAFDKTVVNFDPVAKILVRTSVDIPINEYRIYLHRTGQMTSVRSSY